MRTVLVIEDDQDLAALVALVLESQGYVVDTAANGLEALGHVREHMPDLILLDMKMPVMSGSEFAAEYQARYPESDRAPLIVMTAAAHAARRGQQIGANDFLSKPFSTEELVRVVGKFAQA